ncbi:MAG TPA: DUF1571 domain-containing protein [Myxococcales bacterium]|jgi:hypothetical protein
MTSAVLAAALALALAQSPGAAPSPPDAGTTGASVQVAKTATKEAAFASAVAPPVDKERDVEAVAAAIQRMEKAARALKDFTATFYKKEWKGKQLPEEVIALKYRASPRSVYFRWTGDAYQGQEVLWQKGWNGDKARAHPGSFPDVTVNLPTGHWLMTRSTRHPVPNAGFDFTIAMFARDLVTHQTKPECLVRAVDAGLQVLYGAQARCFEMETDKAKCPEMYSRKARLCIYERLDVPAKIEVWDQEDGALRLVEEYGYGDVKLDFGLSDKDFDPANEDYQF